MMTLLYSDNDIGGLEVMDLAGRRVRVPVIEGAFTVNLGDLMMRWTNDNDGARPCIESSTRRRPRTTSAGDCRSACIFIPNFDAVVAPITGLAEAAKYPRLPSPTTGLPASPAPRASQPLNRRSRVRGFEQFEASSQAVTPAFTVKIRHASTCSGHPRIWKQPGRRLRHVDGRDKPLTVGTLGEASECNEVQSNSVARRFLMLSAM